MHIPFERRIAAGLAKGLTLIAINPDYSQKMQDIYRHISSILASNKG